MWDLQARQSGPTIRFFASSAKPWGGLATALFPFRPCAGGRCCAYVSLILCTSSTVGVQFGRGRRPVRNGWVRSSKALTLYSPYRYGN